MEGVNTRFEGVNTSSIPLWGFTLFQEFQYIYTVGPKIIVRYLGLWLWYGKGEYLLRYSLHERKDEKTFYIILIQ
jgi:hypothetical protein